MCSHYQAVRDPQRLQGHFRLDTLPPEGGRADVWPGHLAPFIRRRLAGSAVDGTVGGDADLSAAETLLGAFGLIPHWATDPRIGRRTYNARSETVADKPSFREAWRHARHAIVPAEAFFEPDWRSGRAVATRIRRADGGPMGIAGLWASWRTPQGELLHSFTMLTIHAGTHALMRHFHRPGDEKRMVVILPEDRYDDWLHADATRSADFLRPYPAQELQAEVPAAPPAPLPPPSATPSLW